MKQDPDDLRQAVQDEILAIETSIEELMARRNDRRAFLRVLDEWERKPKEVANDTTEGEFASADEIADCVREILQEHGQPMHITQLYDAVVARGLRINGKNPKGNLSAKLSPYQDIIYLRDKGWKLTTFRARDEGPTLLDASGAAGGGATNTTTGQIINHQSRPWVKGG